MTQQVIKQGWYAAASQQPSPHFDERPDDQDIRLLVIHNISLPAGQFGQPYITDLFLGRLDCDAHPDFDCLRGLRVSAHCLIRRDGEVIQYVPFSKRAWHAGVSSYNGVENCNHFSVGIEMEGTDNTPYTDEQYQSLSRVTTALYHEYPTLLMSDSDMGLSRSAQMHVAGHEDIAPGRKTDPGRAFDWLRYLSSLSFPENLEP